MPNLRERARQFFDAHLADSAFDEPEDHMAGFARQELQAAAEIAREHIECREFGCEGCTMAEQLERAIRKLAE